MKQLSWLEYVTGKNEHWWIDQVEEILRKHSVPRDDGTMLRDTYIYDANLELFDLIRGVVNEHLKIKMIDGVILHSAILSVVLAAWVKAVTLAKGHDPRRDIEDRAGMLSNLNWWSLSLIAELADSTIYKKAWPDQRWISPFKKAKRSLKEERT